MSLAEVRLWGTAVGAVSWDAERALGAFEYAPGFLPSGVQLAPIHMPLGPGVFRFPELPRAAFSGLPGLVADCLPDRYGNALIDTWLASEGRSPQDFDPVQRLCYVGSRGMGALEFAPTLAERPSVRQRLDLGALVELASEVLQQRSGLQTQLDADGLATILSVGTSAGGARAKAVVAWNPQTDELRSGQLDAPPGFQHWLLKFDGVRANRDRELADPLGYGRIEFAYHLMARRAGITMSDCRLHQEGGRAHFMTRRFDRTEGGRLHLQSLAALLHLDFNQAGAHSYEQAILLLRRLGLPMDDVEELVRRCLFNLVARNQDDHVKNIAFLMDRRGRWRLAPAFDVTWAYNPQGLWTSRHQMTVAGKRDGFDRDDVLALGRVAALKRGRALAILDEVVQAVRGWSAHAEQAGVQAGQASFIAGTHRLDW